MSNTATIQNVKEIQSTLREAGATLNLFYQKGRYISRIMKHNVPVAAASRKSLVDSVNHALSKIH